MSEMNILAQEASDFKSFKSKLKDSKETDKLLNKSMTNQKKIISNI